MENWVQSWRPRANVFFAVFSLPWKSEARPCEVLHLSRKIILANLEIWCSKTGLLSGNQRPDHLTALMNMSLVLRLPRKMHLCRSSSNMSHACHRFWKCMEMLQNPHVVLTFDKVQNPVPLPRYTTSAKVVRAYGALLPFWLLKCASRRNAVQLFNLSTSNLSSRQVAPHPPLRRVYFSTLCTPETSERHSVSRLFYLFGAPCFSCFCLFLFFALLFFFLFYDLHFFLILSLLWLFPPLLLRLSILSEVWLLNFLRHAVSKILQLSHSKKNLPLPWILDCFTCPNYWYFANGKIFQPSNIRNPQRRQYYRSRQSLFFDPKMDDFINGW